MAVPELYAKEVRYVFQSAVRVAQDVPPTKPGPVGVIGVPLAFLVMKLPKVTAGHIAGSNFLGQ